MALEVKMHVLFVCSGNTCRSPMAEGYLRHLLGKGCPGGITVSSAGTFAGEDMPPSRHSVEALKEHGIDISGHRSTGLTVELLERSDLVVAMTRSHRQHIGSLLPAALAKTRLLADFANSSHDIQDPFGGSREDYGFCFEDMRGPLDSLYDDITRSNP